MKLRRQGYEVFVADNGRSAHLMLEIEPIRVVISDVRMPNGGGLELLREMRDRYAVCPAVILMSGHADLTLEDSLAEGASAILQKPFPIQDLLERVEIEVARSKRAAGARYTERPELQFKIDVELSGASDISQGDVVNIGRGGMFLAIRYPLPPVGESIRFKIRVNDVEKKIGVLEGIGKVRWIRSKAAEGLPVGCGVEFVSLTDSSTESLSNLLLFLDTKGFIPKS